MKKIFIAITVGLFAISSFAQQQNKREFSIWAAGGISSLEYDLNQGNHEMGYGGFAGIGYSYFMNYNWSLGIGAEFSLLNAKAKFPSIYDTYRATDRPTTDISLQLETEGQNYEETQKAYYVNVPIMVRFQTDISKKGHKFYIGVGPKIGIPVKATYDAKGGMITSGLEIYPDGEPYTRDPFVNRPDRGFGSYNVDASGDLDLNLNFIAAAEAGIKWKFGNRLALYTGLYIDYGLNDILKGNDRDKSNNFYAYNNQDPANYNSNSVLFSKYATDANADRQSFTDKVHTLSAGLKIQLAFGKSPFSKKEKASAAGSVTNIYNQASDKPYEGLTAAQMEDIMARNTKEILDAFDKLKGKIAQEDPDMTSAIYGFDFSKDQILSQMHPELERKVELMKKYPTARIILEGHTDDKGSVEFNYKLGLDRANAAKAYMVAKGIEANRMTITSKGKSQPIVPNTDETNCRMNRRVEFILQP